MYICCLLLPFFFFLTDTSTTEIYTLSLHDALPIFLVFALEFLEGRHQSLGNIPATIGAKPAGGVPRNFRRSDGCGCHSSALFYLTDGCNEGPNFLGVLLPRSFFHPGGNVHSPGL